MVNLLKYKYKLCRKYEEDLWGFVVGKGKFTRLGEFLSNLNVVGNSRVNRSNIYNKLLKDRKKVCLFYGGLKATEYKRYCAEAKRINKNNFSDTLVGLLERRLDVFVYRLNFVSSVAEGAALVKAGYFTVNRQQILTPHTLLHVGDVVELRVEYRERVRKQLQERLAESFMPILYPRYVEANYQIMAGVLVKNPVITDVYYPFKLSDSFYNISYFSRFA